MAAPMERGPIDLVFATNNSQKLKEIRAIVKDGFRILSLADIGCTDDLPETSATIRGNAIQKATYIFEKYGENCFADDTGLEIEELQGRPGVYSARFAGARASDDDNIDKVLREMTGVINRKARFRTIIALFSGTEQRTFEGVVEGEIATERRGTGGFGYDPVFIPSGKQQSFAEMDRQEKNSMSHRSIAFSKLVSYLDELQSLQNSK